LLEAKKSGLIEKIGVSIYDPKSLDLICSRFPIDLVQAPMNILDNRLFDSGWLDRLNHYGIEVHSRSVFLQGLLLREDLQSRVEFLRWREDFEQLGIWFGASTKTPLAKCVSHITSFGQVSRLVVGVDSESQLMEVIAAFGDAPERAPEFKIRDPDILLNPFKWMKR
jgi:aryl-alcohol dehydrogenase-like predicted oxidoreductase